MTADSQAPLYLGRLFIQEGLLHYSPNSRSRRQMRAKVASVLGVDAADLPRTPTPAEAERLRAAMRQVRAQMRGQLNAGLPTCPDSSRQAEWDQALAAARAAEIAQLRSQFQAQVRQVVAEQIGARIAQLDAREQELQDLEVRLRARLASVTELLSHDEFRQVLSCLHPDRAPADRVERFTQAFQIFQRFEAAANPALPVADLRARGWDHLRPYRRT